MKYPLNPFHLRRNAQCQSNCIGPPNHQIGEYGNPKDGQEEC